MKLYAHNLECYHTLRIVALPSPLSLGLSVERAGFFLHILYFHARIKL